MAFKKYSCVTPHHTMVMEQYRTLLPALTTENAIVHYANLYLSSGYPEDKITYFCDAWPWTWSRYWYYCLTRETFTIIHIWATLNCILTSLTADYLISTSSPTTVPLGIHTLFQIILANAGKGCTIVHYARRQSGIQCLAGNPCASCLLDPNSIE